MRPYTHAGYDAMSGDNFASAGLFLFATFLVGSPRSSVDACGLVLAPWTVVRLDQPDGYRGNLGADCEHDRLRRLDFQL
jgi:hypothetical protein